MNGTESTGRYPIVIDTESLEYVGWLRRDAESGLLWLCGGVSLVVLSPRLAVIVTDHRETLSWFNSPAGGFEV